MTDRLDGAPAPTTQTTAWAVHLFDAWRCSARGRTIELSGREQRVVALLALDGCRSRRHVAGVLWPEATDARAMASLRAALFRIQHAVPGLVVSDRSTVGLADRAYVDVAEFRRVADMVVEDPTSTVATDTLLRPGGELLPGWYEDWVLFERERLRRLRIRTFEALSRQLLRVGEPDAALAAAQAAIALEPLRESAHRAAISAHLASGNRAEAVFAYTTYRRRLGEEVGLAPSPQLVELVRPVLPQQRLRAPSRRSPARRRSGAAYTAGGTPKAR